MNPKNLEGKTLEQQKSLYEVELIADFEMEWGQPDHWDEDTEREFNEKWNLIQLKFKGE